MAFNRDNRSGGGRDSGRRSFGGGRREDREMFKAICSKCGKECEVPFRPTGNKPVYCSDCFRNMSGSDSRRNDDRGSRRQNYDNRNSGSYFPQYKEQFETLNYKLDKILKLLNPEKPAEAVKVAANPKVENSERNKEDAEPVKKKAKVKKTVPVENTVGPTAVLEASSTNPSENPIGRN